MVSTPKYLLVQERLQTDLAVKIQGWRTLGLSFNRIAELLEDEARVPLTGQTIADWVRRLDGTAA